MWSNTQQVKTFLLANWTYYKTDADHGENVDEAIATFFQRKDYEATRNLLLAFLLAPKGKRCSAAYPRLVSTLCGMIGDESLLYDDTDVFLQRAVVEEGPDVLREQEAAISGNCNYTVKGFDECNAGFRRILADGRDRDERTPHLLQLKRLHGEENSVQRVVGTLDLHLRSRTDWHGKTWETMAHGERQLMDWAVGHVHDRRQKAVAGLQQHRH